VSDRREEFYAIQPPRHELDAAAGRRFPGQTFESLNPMFRSMVVGHARDAHVQKTNPSLWAAESKRRDEFNAMNDRQNAARESQRAADQQQRQQQMSRAEHFFHGTVVGRGESFEHDEILPAKQHGGDLFHRNEHDGTYAYATRDLSTAQHYSELAQNWHHDPDRTERVVLRVTPLGSYEKDPAYDQHGRNRANFDGDIRSRAGFRVLGEQWRESHDD
jgi:hypothetical protein